MDVCGISHQNNHPRTSTAKRTSEKWLDACTICTCKRACSVCVCVHVYTLHRVYKSLIFSIIIIISFKQWMEGKILTTAAHKTMATQHHSNSSHSSNSSNNTNIWRNCFDFTVSSFIYIIHIHLLLFIYTTKKPFVEGGGKYTCILYRAAFVAELTNFLSHRFVAFSAEHVFREKKFIEFEFCFVGYKEIKNVPSESCRN